MIAENKTCLYCRKAIHGRADKKFCSDACRNTHHNGLHDDDDPNIRLVNHQLRKNHHILKKVMGFSRSSGRCSRKKMLLSGFNFYYFTHRYVNRHAQECCGCYDFEYRVGDDTVYIARKKNMQLL